MTEHPHEETVVCHECGATQQEPRGALRRLRRSGGAAAQVLDLRVPGARHDLRRAAQGDVPPLRLRQGPGNRHQDDARRQGGRGLLRRDPADDRLRYLRHQRHRARDRVPVAPLAGRLLHQGRQARPTWRRSSRTAARGSSSSTTRRRSCRSASTASASSTAPSSCVPWASRRTRRSCASSTRRSGSKPRARASSSSALPTK